MNTFRKAYAGAWVMGALTLASCEEPTFTREASPPVSYTYGAAASTLPDATLGGDQQACYWDASCDDGFVCIGVCQRAQQDVGVLAGPCDASQRCAPGLECRAGSVCVDPDALASIYSTWTQSEELLDEESELIELNQQLDLFGDFLDAVTPERARLDEFLPPVGNQGGKGSCASWAVGYGMRGYQAAAQRGFWSASTDHLLSPTFLYAQLQNECSGTNTGKNLDLLKSKGIPTLSELPYLGIKAACDTPISDSVRTAAERHKSRSKVTLFNKRSALTSSNGSSDVINDDDLGKIKFAIAFGFPVVISIKTYAEFMRLGTAPLTRITELNKGLHGYHAILVVGYDDTTQMVTILNSWSPTWGHNGYGQIRYDVFKKITGAAFYSRAIAPDDMEMPPTPGPSDMCSGVVNLTCDEDKKELITLCDNQIIDRTSCAEDEACHLKGPNVTGVTGCYTRAEMLASCGEDNLSRRCKPSTAADEAGLIQDVCFDKTLYTFRCGADKLCSTRSGEATCEEEATLQTECMDGLVSACHAEFDRPGVTSIEQRCEDEVVRRVECPEETTCYDRDGAEPSCLTREELDAACGEQGHRFECLDATTLLGPMVVSTCDGKILGIEERCREADDMLDDEDVCRLPLVPEGKGSCARPSTHQIEVVLGWEGAHDLDLFVEQPNGVTISYQRIKDEDTRGIYDASKTCLPQSMTCDPTQPYDERVVWRKDTAPLNGTYKVRLSNGRADVEVPAQLTVYVNDRVKTSRALSSPGVKGRKSEAIEFTF